MALLWPYRAVLAAALTLGTAVAAQADPPKFLTPGSPSPSRNAATPDALKVDGDRVAVTVPMTVDGKVTVRGGVVTGYGSVPVGTIMLWSGAQRDLPTGWELCDGNAKLPDGRPVPDLRGRFVVGQDERHNDYKKVLAADGHDRRQLSLDQMPLHNHGVWMKARLPGGSTTTAIEIAGPHEGYEDADYKHNRATVALYTEDKKEVKIQSQGNADFFPVLPPYYVLSYIIYVGPKKPEHKQGVADLSITSKSIDVTGALVPGSSMTTNAGLIQGVGAVPVGTIIPWVHADAVLPKGWELCDGSGYATDPQRKKPDLRDRFVRGGPVPQGWHEPDKLSGGAKNHRLTVHNLPRHDHQPSAPISFRNVTGNRQLERDRSMWTFFSNDNKKTVVGPLHNSQTKSLFMDSDGSPTPKPVGLLPKYFSVRFIIFTGAGLK